MVMKNSWEMAVTFSSKFVHIDGIRTHYYDEGRGLPVLLLHSGEFGACAELSWEFTLSRLAEHYRVIAPDWLGYGETDKLYDFGGGQARMMTHMRRFMQIMELEKSHVIGNSMGAGLFSRTVASDPGAYRISSLTLIAGGGFNPDNEHRRAMMSYDGTAESMKSMLRAMFNDPKWSEDPEYLGRRVELSLRPGAWETIAAARFKNPTVPVREFFGRPDDTPYENLNMPTLVIAGDEDRLRLPGWERELADKIPTSELHVVHGTGHCPHIERPDEVNEVILDFLSRVAA
jgi:pimeloyl-ACP methyl ester carboxylesterase